MSEEKNKISLEETNNGIIFKENLLKDGKKAFIFNEYINGRWQVVGNVPLNVAKKIALSHFSRYIWIEGREANLDPDKYATCSDEQLKKISKNGEKKTFSISEFITFSKNSGFPRFIKSYDVFSKLGLEYFIGLIKEYDLID